MNSFLVAYLDAIDEDLLAYLDGDQELSVPTVRRMRKYVTTLLEGHLGLGALAEDWADWFHLAPAFVAAYGYHELAWLQNMAGLFSAVKEGDRVELTGADRAYLRALKLQLDVYADSRSGRLGAAALDEAQARSPHSFRVAGTPASFGRALDRAWTGGSAGGHVDGGGWSGRRGGGTAVPTLKWPIRHCSLWMSTFRRTGEVAYV